jgi:hypothetical protein
MDEKKEFLNQFKMTVKREGGSLTSEYILNRIKMGDISESDISSFKKYIPIELNLSINNIMGKRRLMGILKTLNEILNDKAKINEKIPVKDVVDLIKQDRITQEDIQKFEIFYTNTDIKAAIAKQIDRFLKEVLKHKNLSKEEQNKHKFKLERLLRKKIITLNYLEGRANIKDIIIELFNGDYKRYLSEDVYDLEVKEAVDSGYIDETILSMLPGKYIDYYLKTSKIKEQTPASQKSFKKRKDKNGTITRDIMSDADKSNIMESILSMKSKNESYKPATPKDTQMFDNEALMNKIIALEKKEQRKDISELGQKLQALGFKTKSVSKKQKSRLEEMKKDMYKLREKQLVQADPNYMLAPKQKSKTTTSLYSVERKLEDLRKGKKSRFLSKIDKSALEEVLKKSLEIEKYSKGKIAMDIDKPASSPVDSEQSISSSSSSSGSGSRRSSKASSIAASPTSSRRSSVESKTSFVKEKEIKPKSIPSVLLPIGTTSQLGLDTESVKVLSTFVDKSIAYNVGKKETDTSKVLKVNKKKLEKLLEDENKISESYKKRKRNMKLTAEVTSPYL